MLRIILRIKSPIYNTIERKLNRKWNISTKFWQSQNNTRSFRGYKTRHSRPREVLSDLDKIPIDTRPALKLNKLPSGAAAF